MTLKLADLLENEIQQYTLWYKVTKDGYVYFKIRQEMYGLPQAGFLAKKQLEKMINVKGYNQSRLTHRF